VRAPVGQPAGATRRPPFSATKTAGYQPRGGKHPVLASRTMYVDDPDGNEVEFICLAPAD